MARAMAGASPLAVSRSRQAFLSERRPAAFGVGRIGLAGRETFVGFGEHLLQRSCDAPAQRQPRIEHCVGIDIAGDFAGDVGLRRQRDHLRDESRLELAVGQNRR